VRANATSAGSRNESDGPGTWTEPGQAPVLAQVKQVAELSTFPRSMFMYYTPYSCAVLSGGTGVN
jgi:hypothetical protein